MHKSWWQSFISSGHKIPVHFLNFPIMISTNHGMILMDAFGSYGKHGMILMDAKALGSTDDELWRGHRPALRCHRAAHRAHDDAWPLVVEGFSVELSLKITGFNQF